MDRIASLQAILVKTVRTDSELFTLKDSTKDIEFFLKLKQDHGTDELHSSLCRVMQTVQFEAGEVIFHFGDRGDHFFIVLEGKVEIKVPPKNESTQRDSLVSTLSRVSFMSKQSSEVTAAFQRRFTRTKLFIPNEVPANPRDESDFTKVAELGPGKSFGELALMKGGGLFRNASVKCLELTTLLTITRDDFNKLLGSLQEKRLHEKITFLSKVEGFKSMSKGALHKLSYYFTLKHYRRGEQVYREGQDPDNVYVVLSGEFEVSPI
jgi:CRP-like cAMP-binding protein